jgi:hypothetical protein
MGCRVSGQEIQQRVMSLDFTGFSKNSLGENYIKNTTANYNKSKIKNQKLILIVMLNLFQQLMLIRQRPGNKLTVVLLCTRVT